MRRKPPKPWLPGSTTGWASMSVSIAWWCVKGCGEGWSASWTARRCARKWRRRKAGLSTESPPSLVLSESSLDLPRLVRGAGQDQMGFARFGSRFDHCAARREATIDLRALLDRQGFVVDIAVNPRGAQNHQFACGDLAAHGAGKAGRIGLHSADDLAGVALHQ